jgi:heme/copper-type cytochrome/quinol oxidase subunit 1
MELFWLGISFLATIIIGFFIFNWSVFDKNIYIGLQDMPITISAPIIIIPVFLFISFLLFFFKELGRNFSNTLPNFIILSSGLLLIALFILLNKELIRLGTSFGWTVYPPMSGLQEYQTERGELNPFIANVSNTLSVLQMILTIMLLFVTYRWGTQREQSS